MPRAFDRLTTIGRYCSISKNVRAFNRNHPLEFKSQHGFFFNPVLNKVTVDPIKYTPLSIGNDVWIGDGAIILPNVEKICDGAVVAAGAVVNKDVAPYAVVVGNPARVVRYRFSQEIIDRLLQEKWWEKDIDEIMVNIDEYTQPYEAYLSAHNLVEDKNHPNIDFAED